MATETIAKRPVLVVAAALVDGDGRVLVQQRPPGKSMAGLWEFPGGKVEDGETHEGALARELREELGIEVDQGALEPGPFASAMLGDRSLLLLLYIVRVWSGTPVPLHATALAWHRVEDLARLEMPPADGPLVARLPAFIARQAPTLSS